MGLITKLASLAPRPEIITDLKYKIELQLILACMHILLHAYSCMHTLNVGVMHGFFSYFGFVHRNTS